MEFHLHIRLDYYSQVSRCELSVVGDGSAGCIVSESSSRVQAAGNGTYLPSKSASAKNPWSHLCQSSHSAPDRTGG